MLGDHGPRPVDTTASWAEIAAGDDHICAIRADRTLWCWGSNRDGHFGTGTGWSSTWVTAAVP